MITLSFLAVMLLYGLFAGFGKIPLVLWFLLAPFAMSDLGLISVSDRVWHLYQMLIFHRL